MYPNCEIMQLSESDERRTSASRCRSTRQSLAASSTNEGVIRLEFGLLDNDMNISRIIYETCINGNYITCKIVNNIASKAYREI